MLTHSLASLLSKETIGSLIAAIPIIKIILNYFHKPLDDIDDLYKKAKISTWRVRLFMITISTKKIPKLTHIDITLFSFLILCLSSALVAGSFYSMKMIQIKDGWTSLTLKETNEWFLITTNRASEHAFKPSWYITEESCQSGETTKLVNEKKITHQLEQFICDSFITHSDHENIEKSIKYTDNNKSILIALTIITTAGFLWFIISLLLTIIYTVKLKNCIVQEHKKAYHYLT